MQPLPSTNICMNRRSVCCTTSANQDPAPAQVKRSALLQHHFSEGQPLHTHLRETSALLLQEVVLLELIVAVELMPGLKEFKPAGEKSRRRDDPPAVTIRKETHTHTPPPTCPAPPSPAGLPRIVLGSDAGLKPQAVPGHVLGQLVDDGLDVGWRWDDGGHLRSNLIFHF